MKFQQLRYILEVAEERSFSKAAQNLFIAQPSLSQSIQSLEQQLGVRLFDRATTPISLTYAGEVYVESAKQILALEKLLSEQMSELANLKKGRIIVGVSPYHNKYILPRILPVFQRQYPGIDIVSVEKNTVERKDALLRGTIDISITSRAEKDPGLEYQLLLKEEILLALPPAYPLSEQLGESPFPAVALDHFKDQPFIMLKKDQALHIFADELFKRSGFKPRILMEIGNIDATIAMVMENLGLAFVPDTIVNNSNIKHTPIYCTIDKLFPSREVVVAYRTGHPLSQSAAAFIATAKNIFSV